MRGRLLAQLRNKCLAKMELFQHKFCVSIWKGHHNQAINPCCSEHRLHQTLYISGKLTKIMFYLRTFELITAV